MHTWIFLTHEVNDVILHFCQIKFRLLWPLTSGLPQLRADFSSSTSFRFTLMSQANSKQWLSRFIGIFSCLTCCNYLACNWKLANSFFRTWLSSIMCLYHWRLWFSPFKISKHLRFRPLGLSTFLIMTFGGCDLFDPINILKINADYLNLAKKKLKWSITSCYSLNRTSSPWAHVLNA